MSKAKQSGGGSGELPIETDFRLKQERTFEPKKSAPVERPEIAFIEPPGPDEVEIPEQKQHFDLPVRFGAVPVDNAPLGWEVETRRAEFKVTKFQHAYEDDFRVWHHRRAGRSAADHQERRGVSAQAGERGIDLHEHRDW